MQQLTSAELPNTIEAPSLARRLLNEHAAGIAHEQLGDALVLVSELATNAVVHGAAPITLSLYSGDAGATMLRVEVQDAGDGVPAAASAPAPTQASGGRGLLIVAALASAWGVRPATSGIGKVTWFEIGGGA